MNNISYTGFKFIITLRARIVAWKAQRIEKLSHRMRRALRDHNRAARLEIVLTERRARDLRIYAAWVASKPTSVAPQTIVMWRSESEKAVA